MQFRNILIGLLGLLNNETIMAAEKPKALIIDSSFLEDIKDGHAETNVLKIKLDDKNFASMKESQDLFYLFGPVSNINCQNPHSFKPWPKDNKEIALDQQAYKVGTGLKLCIGSRKRPSSVGEPWSAFHDFSWIYGPAPTQGLVDKNRNGIHDPIDQYLQSQIKDPKLRKTAEAYAKNLEKGMSHRLTPKEKSDLFAQSFRDLECLRFVDRKNADEVSKKISKMTFFSKERLNIYISIMQSFQGGFVDHLSPEQIKANCQKD